MAKRDLILDEFLPYRLSVAANLVSDTLADVYKALFGLTVPEWRLIAVVAAHDGISQQEIGFKTRMDKVTVSRAAIALTKRGLFDRRANHHDKRSHLLVLSAAGRALHAQVAPKAVDMERRLLESFDEAEVTALKKLLRRIEMAALRLQGAGAMREGS